MTRIPSQPLRSAREYLWEMAREWIDPEPERRSDPVRPMRGPAPTATIDLSARDWKDQIRQAEKALGARSSG